MKRNNLVMATALAALLAGPQASVFAMDAPYTPPMGAPTTGDPLSPPASYPGVAPPVQIGQGIDPNAAAWLDTEDIDYFKIADPTFIQPNGWMPLHSLDEIATAKAEDEAGLVDDSDVIDPNDPVEIVLKEFENNNGLLSVPLQAVAPIVLQQAVFGMVDPLAFGGVPLGVAVACAPIDPGGDWDFVPGPWHWLDVGQFEWTLPGLKADMQKAGLKYRELKALARRIQIQGQLVQIKVRPFRMYQWNAENMLWYWSQRLPATHVWLRYCRENIIKWKNKRAPLEARYGALWIDWQLAQQKRDEWFVNFHEALERVRAKQLGKQPLAGNPG